MRRERVAGLGVIRRQRARGLRVCSLSFFTWRFSLSDLPDFLEVVLRGDLSVMSTPFPNCNRTPVFIRLTVGIGGGYSSSPVVSRSLG
jgi:hypothetical protein